MNDQEELYGISKQVKNSGTHCLEAHTVTWHCTDKTLSMAPVFVRGSRVSPVTGSNRGQKIERKTEELSESEVRAVLERESQPSGEGEREFLTQASRESPLVAIATRSIIK